ncbi:MAG: polyamine aminopropyltransferase [Thiohalomonadales bacterium]
MSTQSTETSRKESFILILSVFIAGLCSLIYELLIGTTSSYFLGDSIKQFSLTIGVYMAAMGLGSYLSRLVGDKYLLENFIAFEIALGLLGGISIPVLYFAFSYTDSYGLFMFTLIILIGTLIGLEIPLLTRIMERFYALKVNISNVLSIDYLGALVATLLFPFLFLPFFGTFKTGLAFGLINMSIGFLNLWCFSEQIQLSRKRILYFYNTTVALFILFLLIFSNTLLSQWNASAYNDRVVFSKESKYQNITVTKNKDDLRLFLNGNLQFSSADEYRYHETLIHVPMLYSKQVHEVLLLGGGDGLAVRELLKYPEIKTITVVDLDPEITRLAKQNRHFLKVNKGSFASNKVNIVHEDAFVFLKQSTQEYDLIIADLPDPNNPSLSRLYSNRFYRLIYKNLRSSGLFITQATSPFYAKKVFWSIHATLAHAGFSALLPLHVNVPSFGEWGFIIASKSQSLQISRNLLVETRFIEAALIDKITLFEKDLVDHDVEINTLDKPVILGYYIDSWRYWD